MALRIIGLRTAPILPLNRCYARHFSSFRGCLLVAQDLLVASPAKPTSPSYCQHRQGHQYNSFHCINARSFSSSDSNVDDTSNKSSSKEEENNNANQQPVLLYEGPFASLTLKLKRISLTSAVIGIVGLPALSMFYGSGGVPPTGQLAIIATAGVTAVGSTALLGYCFSPYVHTLERLPAGSSSSSTSSSENGEVEGDATATINNNELVRIVTRDILARRVETIFDPTSDVSPPPSNNSRPFCNFMVKELPMYVHPEMIHDHTLRVQLVGEEPEQPPQDDDKNKKKLDDDEFL